MHPLQILLLGPPEIRWQGELIAIQRRTPRALLFYLAARGRIIGRGELLPLFWEDLPERTARLRLRETLGKLRGELPEPDVLMTEADLIGINLTRVYVDLLKFEHLVQEAGNIPWKTPATEPLPVQTYPLLDEALQLWRGTSFLAGVDWPSSHDLDNWLSNTSQRVNALHTRLLERMSDHALTMGDLEQALTLAQRAAQGDEFDETRHERVLRILLEMGRHQEAREYFNHTHDLFQNELGFAPGARLTRLYQQAEAGSRFISKSQSVRWNVRPSLQAPFVDRQEIMTQLNSLYHKGGSAFLFGESGIGKTRLMQEFAAQLKPAPRVFLVNCLPGESDLPLQPMIEFCRQWLNLEDWQNLPPQWAKYLARVIPDLFAARSDLESYPEAGPEQAQAALLESIRQLGIFLAHGQRTLAILDDAQWADQATLNAVAYLIERLPPTDPVFMLIAARSEESNPHLEQIMASLQRAGRLSVLRLARLNPDAMTEMVRGILGAPPAPRLISQLAKDAGGNPLFVLESLRVLLDRSPQLEMAQLDHLPLAPSIYTLIQGRLRLLSPLARDVLDAAAITATDFTPGWIEQVSQHTPEETACALEELELRQFVEPALHETADLRYRFIHEKIRETLLLEIRPARAQVLHGRVARASEAVLGPLAINQSAVLAEHYEAAGELEQAFDRWAQAGLRAWQVYAIPETFRAFGRAEKLIEKLGSRLSDEHIHRLYIEWNDIARDVNDRPALQRLNRYLFDLAESRQSRLLKVAALVGLGDVHFTDSQFEQALVYLDRAIENIGTMDNAIQRVRTHSRRGVNLFILGRYRQAQEALEQALSQAEDSQHPLVMRERVVAQAHLGMLYSLAGWPALGRQHGVQALESQAFLNRPIVRLLSYDTLAMAHYLMGELDEAEEFAQVGLGIAERAAYWRLLGNLSALYAMIELGKGRLGAALLAAQRAVQLGETYGHPETSVDGYRALGDIYALLKDYRRSISFYQRSIQLGCIGYWAIDTRVRMGYNLCWMGQMEDGWQQMCQAIESAKNLGLGVAIFGQVLQGIILVMQGRYDQAKALVIQVQQETQRRALNIWWILSEFVLGALSFFEEAHGAATDRLKKVAEYTSTIPAPWLEIETHLLLTRLLSAQGLPIEEHRERLNTLLGQIQQSLPTDPAGQGEEATQLIEAFLKFSQAVLSA